jgi:hypothetical protein
VIVYEYMDRFDVWLRVSDVVSIFVDLWGISNSRAPIVYVDEDRFDVWLRLSDVVSIFVDL